PGIGVVKNLDEAGTVLKALFNGAETLTPALAAAAKISPEAAEWLMKGIAKYGDTVTDLLHGAAKNADDAAEWGLLVSAVRKAEDSGGILKSADELIEGAGDAKSILNSGSKTDALKSVEDLPSNIQPKIKSFFKGGSNSYIDFSVEPMENGSYMVKMTKPGNVPGSKASYYKVIDYNGNTIRVYKETYDPAGNLVHVKDK
ncbi:hypothetical protein, partial [Papillibacter cinnamivorans]